MLRHSVVFPKLCFKALLLFLSLLVLFYFFGRPTHQLLLVSTTLSVQCLLEGGVGGVGGLMGSKLTLQEKATASLSQS